MCHLGSRRFGTVWQGLSPVLGQKLIKPVDSAFVDARKHIGKWRDGGWSYLVCIRVPIAAARWAPRSELPAV